LWIVLEAWKKGDRQSVERMVKEKEMAGGVGDREWFHWLDGIKDMTAVLEIHRRIRRLVRQEAAELG
jgi:putative component of toxin-antitoxin plasmid stabilization module